MFFTCSSPPMNRTPPPLAFQNPSPSSGQPFRPAGTQRLEKKTLLAFFLFVPPYIRVHDLWGKVWSETGGDGINQVIYFFHFDFFWRLVKVLVDFSDWNTLLLCFSGVQDLAMEYNGVQKVFHVQAPLWELTNFLEFRGKSLRLLIPT